MMDKLFPPPTGEVSLWMDAPPAEVWDLVSDVTRIGEFSPETFEAKWTRGASGPEVGAYFAGHVKRNGVGPTYWSPCRVTACEPERLFEFSVGTDSVTVNNWGYRLEPKEASHLVNAAGVATSVGLPREALMKFMLKLMANLTDPRGGDVSDRIINGLSKVAPAA